MAKLLKDSTIVFPDGSEEFIATTNELDEVDGRLSEEVERLENKTKDDLEELENDLSTSIETVDNKLNNNVERIDGNINSLNTKVNQNKASTDAALDTKVNVKDQIKVYNTAFGKEGWNEGISSQKIDMTKDTLSVQASAITANEHNSRLRDLENNKLDKKDQRKTISTWAFENNQLYLEEIRRTGADPEVDVPTYHCMSSALRTETKSLNEHKQNKDNNHNVFFDATGKNVKTTYTTGLNTSDDHYKKGQVIFFKNLEENAAGQVYYQAGILDRKPIVKHSGTNGYNFRAGEFKVGAVYCIVYDGSNFVLQGKGGEDYGTATPADVLEGKTIATENGLVSGTIVDGVARAKRNNQKNFYVEGHKNIFEWQLTRESSDYWDYGLYDDIPEKGIYLPPHTYLRVIPSEDYAQKGEVLIHKSGKIEQDHSPWEYVIPDNYKNNVIIVSAKLGNDRHSTLVAMNGKEVFRDNSEFSISPKIIYSPSKITITGGFDGEYGFNYDIYIYK